MLPFFEKIHDFISDSYKKTRRVLVKYKKQFLAIIVSIIVLIGGLSLFGSNFTPSSPDTQLIDDISDYANYGYHNVDEPVIYKNQVLTEGHLPFIIGLNGDNPNLDATDLENFITSEIADSTGTHKDISIIYRILINQTYNVLVPVYKTENYTYNITTCNSTGIDYSSSQDCIDNCTDCWNHSTTGTRQVVDYYDNQSRYHWVWKDISSLSSYQFENTQAIVDIQCNFNAGISDWGVDLVPTIKVNDQTETLNQWAWWNSDWDYRKTITINHTQVPSTLSNFPIALNISFSDVNNNKTQDNGDDIAFVNGTNDTQYNHEIEYFDETDYGIFWVNVTSLNSTSDTIINMYYGNDVCGNQENVAGTWDNGYVLVYHFTESSGTVYDSTSNNNDATSSGGSPGYQYRDANSPCGYGIDFEGSTGEYISAPHSSSLDITDNLVIESWINPESFSYDRGTLCTKQGTYYSNYPTSGKLSVYCYGPGDSSSFYMDSSTTFSTNSWQHTTWKEVDGDRTIYYNGDVDKTGSYESGIDSDNSKLQIGQYDSGHSRRLDAKIDELRISDIDRSNNWVKTNYNTMNNAYDGGFYSMSSEQTEQVDNFEVTGLKNNKITWSSNLREDIVWTNSSGEYNETLKINITDNTTSINNAYVHMSTLVNSTIGDIGTSNLTLFVSSDNSSFGVPLDNHSGNGNGVFSNGISTIIINSTTWNTSSMGTNPFPLTISDCIYLRFKLKFPSSLKYDSINIAQDCKICVTS